RQWKDVDRFDDFVVRIGEPLAQLDRSEWSAETRVDVNRAQRKDRLLVNALAVCQWARGRRRRHGSGVHRVYELVMTERFERIEQSSDLALEDNAIDDGPVEL